MTRFMIPDPPSGYQLEEAVVTTFDLDIDSLLELIGSEQAAGKFLVFRGDGEFRDSSAAEPCGEALRNQIVKVAWPVPQSGFPEAYFHAKLWLFVYQNPSGDRKWRLVIQSANIFPYENLEASVQFSGANTGKPQPETAPVCAFLSALLPFLAENVPAAGEKRRRLTALIHRLETVRFTPCVPAASDPLQQAAASSEAFSFFVPSCDGVPFLKEPYDELLAVSPVVSSARLCALAERAAPGGRCVVLTNAETVGKVLSESDPKVQWLLPRPGDPYVHAKLFLVRRGAEWTLYCGSMNLTDYAVERNQEFMVHLEAAASIGSIEAFAAALTGREETEIARELGQYDEGDPPLCGEASAVFCDAARVCTRIEYLRRLLRRKKLDAEESRQAVFRLLTARCADDLTLLLRDPNRPSFPVRKTITVNQKQRDVFSLPFEEMLLLGLLNHALHRYDGFFSPNVFLHIRDRRPTDVFRKIRAFPGFADLCLLRTDIHAFDPSMDADVLSAGIHRLFSFDAPLCAFLDRIVYRRAYRLEPDGQVFTDGPAQPTGLPLCGFFENVYLQGFDALVERQAAFYARCGDDILIGAGTEEALRGLLETVRHAAEERRLSLSEEKTLLLRPGEPFVFLGWQVAGGTVDFSEEALKRIENGIRRQTQRLLLRYGRAHIPKKLRLPSLIKLVERGVQSSGICASFRIVTVPNGLNRIDRMLSDAIRTVSTGKKGKSKYRISYDCLRAWGYRSLVNRYYRQLSR